MAHPSGHPLAAFTLALCDRLTADLPEYTVTYGSKLATMHSLMMFTAITIEPFPVNGRATFVHVGDGRVLVESRDQMLLSKSCMLELADPEFFSKLYDLVQSDKLYISEAFGNGR